MRQIQLDGGIEHINVIVETPHFAILRQFTVHHFPVEDQHMFDHVAHAQGFTGGIGQRQRRGINCADIQMARTQTGIIFRHIGNHHLANLRHRRRQRHHRQTTDQVVEHVEVDHQFFIRNAKPRQLRRQQSDKRQHNHQTNQFKQRTAERHAATGGIHFTGVNHRQQPAAEVGTDDQTK
ncbi:hypothetical protein SRABI106_04025 [Rahnella aquatilis]|nr:hypothetical protein SRABI106_04025 [Rahnella aquatilis]